MTEDITPAAGSPESLVLSLISLITNPKAAKDHLVAIVAERAEADKRLAAADKRAAEVAAQAAEIGRRQHGIMARELELHTKSQRIEGRHAELSTRAKHLSEIEDQIKIRLLRHAGLLQNFNPSIQSMPSWAAVDLELGSAVDAHYDGNDTTTVRDEAGENEVPENLVAGSTLVPSRPRPPRPTRADMVRGA